MTKAGPTNYVLSADLSPIGAGSVVLEAYRGGQLVEQTTASASTGLFDNLATCAVFNGDLEISCCPLSWSVTWHGGSSACVPINGTAVVCDQLVVIPQVAGLSMPVSVSLLGSQLGSLSVTNLTTSLPPPPVLSAILSGQTLTIQWTGGGTLQQSTNLVNWADVSGATSPYTPSRTEQAQFYRVQQ
jgi:hypothetical protein